MGASRSTAIMFTQQSFLHSHIEEGRSLENRAIPGGAIISWTSQIESEGNSGEGLWNENELPGWEVRSREGLHVENKTVTWLSLKQGVIYYRLVYKKWSIHQDDWSVEDSMLTRQCITLSEDDAGHTPVNGKQEMQPSEWSDVMKVYIRMLFCGVRRWKMSTSQELDLRVRQKNWEWDEGGWEAKTAESGAIPCEKLGKT